MSKPLDNLSWIGVDWGTSNVRAWGMDDTGNVLCSASSNDGMGKLSPKQFESALLKLIEPWLEDNTTMSVICCGMVGARGGWQEAGYLTTPCAPSAPDGLVQVAAIDRRLNVSILPGIRQQEPPDVMRGEETQIAGVLACFTDFNGVVCLPGTHSKWVKVGHGEILEFTSFMTGELFELLTQKSILHHSLKDEGWDEAAFDVGLIDAMQNPAMFSTKLFGLRAGSLLQDESSKTTRAKLSGLLIGLEIAAMKDIWGNNQVKLVGSSLLAKHYSTALKLVGANFEVLDAEKLVLAGLGDAYKKAT